MSAQIIDIIAKRALKDVAKKNINSKDPYFEEVPVYGRNGRPTGKVKKQKKGVPPGLSENDARVLKQVRRRAYRLDMSLFNCCGIRFGWSSVIAIIPVIGDFVDVFMAWMVLRTCMKIDGGLPAAIQSRMYFNIALDFALGLVPFLGDIADAIFRANTRNAWVLEEYLIKKTEEEGKLQSRPAAGVTGGPSDPGLITRPPVVQKMSSTLRGAFGGGSRRADEEMAVGEPYNNKSDNHHAHQHQQHQQHQQQQQQPRR